MSSGYQAQKRARRKLAGGMKRAKGECMKCRRRVDDREGIRDENGLWLCPACYTKLSRRFEKVASEVNARVNHSGFWSPLWRG